VIEALVALILSILVLAVFGGPAWALKMSGFGGLGFVFWVLILVIEWLVGKIKAP
jgi:hypothetical protein